MKGRIKYYNELKGFGFIVAEDNNDYFFHVSNLKSLQLPTLGALVEFTGSKNEKGFSAVKIEIMNSKHTSSIIVFDEVRIRKNNIKNYGITTKEFPYEKIYDMDVKFHSGFSKFLFGEKTTSLSWNGRLEIISEERFRELKAVNERESYKQPGNMPWRVDVDGLFSTYKRYRNSSGNILESEEFTNESDSANPPYEMKDIKCLYVSTYQNDNFLFREDQCSFNIHEKCAEIDLAFSS